MDFLCFITVHMMRSFKLKIKRQSCQCLWKEGGISPSVEAIAKEERDAFTGCRGHSPQRGLETYGLRNFSD